MLVMLQIALRYHAGRKFLDFAYCSRALYHFGGNSNHYAFAPGRMYLRRSCLANPASLATRSDNLAKLPTTL